MSLAEKRATYQPSVARQPVKKRSLPVKRRTRASKRPLLLNVLVLALVICSGLTVAARGATLASVGYQIEDCRAQLAAVQEENRRLACKWLFGIYAADRSRGRRQAGHGATRCPAGDCGHTGHRIRYPDRVGQLALPRK